MKILCFGKLDKSFSDIAIEYLKRVKWKIEVIEQNVKYDDVQKSLSIEAELIKKYLSPGDFNIVLDEKGKSFSSFELAEIINNNNLWSVNINFIIGGTYGLHKEIKSLANLTMSLSNFTFNHMFARIILLEQIYRAQAIIEGHPYHK